ncbi:ribonuclease H-like domain-containing protein, partial [Tanacetum coccineum]
NENDAGHFQSEDVSTSENGSFVANEDTANIFEGSDYLDHTQEDVIQDNNDVQNLERSSRTSVFPNKFNDLVVKSKVKYGLDKYVNYSHLIDLPVGRKAISSKWVWKIKYKFNGEVERYKARVVAKGDNQREGIDSDENFSLVVKIVTVRCLINLAVQSGWSLLQMDINNVFLYGDLNETVYMTLTPGYFPPNKTKVCKLNKSLYGKYCFELIDEFGLLAGKPSNLPMQPNYSLSGEASDTGPFMHNPLKSHMRTALKVIKYLKGSPSKGINVIKGYASGIDLKAYSDADWARCTDSRRSITGYCVFMCGYLVS